MQQITVNEAYYNRGIANFYLENFQGALEDLNEALQIQPTNTKFLIARGIIYSALGAIEEAIQDYNKVLKINPNNYYAYFNRAVAYSIVGNKQKAIYDYNRALQINPDKTDAYYNRGNIRYELGDKHGAICDYDLALQINPDKADAYYNRGSIYYELTNQNKAIEDLKKAADIYKKKNQDIDYQDAIQKIKSLENTQCKENRVEINLPQNYSDYQFDVLVQHKDIWEQLLQDLAASRPELKNNIKSNWQIVSRKNKKFIRIKFYGTDEKCLILSEKLAEYKESHLKYIKSDFDTHINNEAIQTESLIDNTDQEFDKISDNNYSDQFGSYARDTWIDCGYMNDIINPYEVY
jgi:tetratricopeptide (TPR) repeat protein